MFQFPGLARTGYIFTSRLQVYPVGFPHSEISGSQSVSDSPELIAAVHVLHRLPPPRHPPYALCSLTVSLRHASNLHSLAKLEFRTPQALFDDTLDLPSYSFFNDRVASILAFAHIPSRLYYLAFQILHLTFQIFRPGGADRARTDDLRLAKPALSQLSYNPNGILTPYSWARAELNCRPHAYQACALTI